MDPYINIGIRAARKAGQIILNALDQLDSVSVIEKAQNDYVTQVDQMAEKAIIDTIHQSYPKHGILSEEVGEIPGEESVTWIIDPLDGTTNFIHGIPQFCISIAVKIKEHIEHAIVFDPFKNELFTATRGSGAQLNHRRLRVSRTHHLEKSLLGTGFPFRHPQVQHTYMQSFQSIFSQCSGVRRMGSAALDLAYVAAGRFEGFWEFGLKDWDVAAGSLLVKEAGGLVTNFKGEDKILGEKSIIAASPKILKPMLQILQKQWKDIV